MENVTTKVDENCSNVSVTRHAYSRGNAYACSDKLINNSVPKFGPKVQFSFNSNTIIIIAA